MVSKETLQEISKKATSVIFFFMCTGIMGGTSFFLFPLISPSLGDMPFIEHWAIAMAVLSFSFIPHLIGGRGWCPICIVTDKIGQKLTKGGQE